MTTTRILFDLFQKPLLNVIIVTWPRTIKSVSVSTIPSKEKSIEEAVKIPKDETKAVTTITPKPASFPLTMTVNFKISSTQIRFGQSICQGKFTNVFEGKWQGKSTAIKCFFKTSKFNPKEKMILEKTTQLNLEGVVHYFGSFYLNRPSAHYHNECLVMEYLPAGSVMSYLKKARDVGDYDYDWVEWPSKINMCKLLKNASRIIATLHGANIIHGDLKWANFLLADDKYLYSDNYEVKVIDFGFAIELSPGENFKKLHDVRGTTGYMAPEILTESKYSKESDIYAFGSMVYVLGSRENVFSNYSSKEANRKVIAGERASLFKVYPDDFKVIIERCWAHNSFDRPTAQKLHEELSSILSDEIKESETLGFAFS